MGYYSDVGLAMYKKDFEDMLKFFKKESKDAYDTWTCADDYQLFENRKDASNPVILARIYSTKWYNEFPEVIYTQDYLNSCEDKEIEYQFIRLGEDLDDNDEQYFGDLWEYCSIVRDIQPDISPKLTGNYSQIFHEVSLANINEII